MNTHSSTIASREAARHIDGEFGTQPHAESGLVGPATLDARQLIAQQKSSPRQYGDVTNVQEGSRTPWGTADCVTHVAPGIVSVSTPGHGGVKLSPERNSLIPIALRQRSGWYEEDCEVNIVGWQHPESLPHYLGGDLDAIRADCEARVRSQFPDEYETATGTPVPVEESWVLRDRAAKADVDAFRDQHANDEVTTGQNGGSHTWMPDGYELVETETRSSGEKRVLMVRKGFWGRNDTHSTNTPIVTSKAENAVDVTNLAGRLDEHYRTHYHPELPKRHDVTTDYSGLSEAARVRADRELTKVYQLPDGDTGSIVDYFNQVGVTGKSGVYYGGKNSPSYRVELGESRIQPVSKAAYDAINVPDTSTDIDRAHFETGRAEAALDRAEKYRAENWTGSEKVNKAKAAVAAARAVAKSLEDAHRAPTNALLAQLKSEAAALVADRTADTDI